MALDVDKLAKLSEVNILVVGDVMLDRYWFGDVERISPEAPVPIVAVTQTEERVGGAANVALNIVSIGAQCSLLSVIGNDEAGHKIRRLVTSSAIDDLLASDDHTQTTVKLRLLSRNQQLLRADFERRPNAELLAQCYRSFVDQLSCTDVVLLSDYGKGGLSHIEKMIDAATARKIPVYIDPKGPDFSRYRGASMVTPNLHEFKLATNKTLVDDEGMAQAAETLMREHQIDSVLVTLSERGMMLFRAGMTPVYSHARAREVYDVSGAGDTVIAMLALAAAANLDDHDALALANCAAGIVVSKLGTTPVDKTELKAAIKREMTA